ncbi:hypothetical protein [Serinicoccus profundi]|uniref:hypothetical protein n=1 Tax=Serinicoccus profundi TaxID=1078471 RepID=UPI000255EA96|nr:hypothetical protein [Serinicoccus profundi]
MSTVRPPPRIALRRWIDDAAVFPPGEAPVAVAWRRHLELLDGGYGDLVGPLLVGVGHVAELTEVAAAHPRGREPDVDVSVVARAGTPVPDLLDAVHRVVGAGVPLLGLWGVELAHDGTDGWREALTFGRPLAVELPRVGHKPAMADLGRARAEGCTVLAKLRTQATAQAAPPSAEELAAFLVTAHEHGLPVKLTGGLHHALPTEVDGHHEHGCLNVLVAAARVAAGADLDEAVAVLGERDHEPLVAEVLGWSGEQMQVTREVVSSFGCCGVLDPIRDLVSLGLLPEASPGPRLNRMMP